MERRHATGTSFRTKSGKICVQETLGWVDGKRKYVSGYGDTLEEAQDNLAVNRRKRTTFKKPSKIARDRTPKRTLRKVIEHWQEANKGKLTQTHLQRVPSYIALHLPEFLDTPIVELTEPIVKREFMQLQAKLAATPFAYQNVYKALQTYFNYAIKQGWINRSPLRNVDCPVVAPLVAVDDERYIEERTQVFEGFLRWIKANSPNDYCWILFMVLGLRRSELCGLELESFELLKNELAIDRQFRKSPNRIELGTKTKQVRRVDLPPDFRIALDEWMQLRQTPIEPWAKNQLFPYKRKDGSWHGRNTDILYEQFTKLLNEYGKTIVEIDGVTVNFGDFTLPWEVLRFRPHYMRHIAASYFAHRQISLDIAQAILGHLDKKMTEHYTHIMSSAKRLATEQAFAHLTK